jgi:hypothetical protein
MKRMRGLCGSAEVRGWLDRRVGRSGQRTVNPMLVLQTRRCLRGRERGGERGQRREAREVARRPSHLGFCL